MPVKTGKDSEGCFARWGDEGKKYHYECGNEDAKDKAKEKAYQQGLAATDGELDESEIMTYNDYTPYPVHEELSFEESAVEIKEGKQGGSPYALITIIQEGVSKNKFKYSKEKLQELNELIQNSGRNKFYVNHSDDESKFGRVFEDWGATLRKSWVMEDSGKSMIKGEIDFDGAPKGAMILNAIKAHPQEVQFSIDAYAAVREVEQEDGPKIKEVEKWYAYKSTDIVTNASAGGKTDRVFASVANEELAGIYEAERTFKEELANINEQEAIHSVLNTFRTFLYDLSWQISEEDGSKQEKIKQLASDFINKFQKSDIVQTLEADVKDTARTESQLNFDGTETINWDSAVDMTFEFYREAYYKHEGGKPENEEDIPSDVSEAPQSMLNWMANTSIMGKATADTFEYLVYFPVVNPDTLKLNRTALDAGYNLVNNADISEDQKDRLINRIVNLANKYFDVNLAASYKEKDMDEFKNVKELEAAYPELTSEMITEAAEKAVENYEKDSKTEDKLKEFKAKVETLESSVEEKDKEVEKLKEELKDYKEKEEKEKRKAEVIEMINESEVLKEVGFDNFPTYFQKQLVNADGEEELKEAIESLESVYKTKESKQPNLSGTTEPRNTIKEDAEEVDLDNFSLI